MERARITPETTVDDVLTCKPGASGLLLDLGVDTCCGGSLSLAIAAHDAGVDVDVLLRRLESMGD